MTRQIPPEFAHDVHGHGLNDGILGAPGGMGDVGNGGVPSASKAAPRGGGRKSEAGRSIAAGLGVDVNGSGARERSSSLSGMNLGGSSGAAAAAAAAAAVTAAASGLCGGGHNRVGAGGGAFMGQMGDGMKIEDSDWDGGQGPLPSLDMVTGGLRKLHGGRHGSGGGKGAGAEVRGDKNLCCVVRLRESQNIVGPVYIHICSTVTESQTGPYFTGGGMPWWKCRTAVHYWLLRREVL